MDSDNILLKILEWAWIAVAGAMVHLYRKAFGLETRTILLENQQENFERQRIEDRQLRDAQRKEIVNRIDNHHDAVMTRLDTISDKD